MDSKKISKSALHKVQDIYNTNISECQSRITEMQAMEMNAENFVRYMIITLQFLSYKTSFCVFKKENLKKDISEEEMKEILFALSDVFDIVLEKREVKSIVLSIKEVEYNSSFFISVSPKALMTIHLKIKYLLYMMEDYFAFDQKLEIFQVNVIIKYAQVIRMFVDLRMYRDKTKQEQKEYKILEIFIKQVYEIQEWCAEKCFQMWVTDKSMFWGAKCIQFWTTAQDVYALFSVDTDVEFMKKKLNGIKKRISSETIVKANYGHKKSVDDFLHFDEE